MTGHERVAALTGAAQGIGRQTALRLAERGYRIAIIDLRPPTDTLDRIRAAGSEAISYEGDITDDATVERFVQQVFDRFHRADVLVNNAGISHITPAEDTTAHDYRRVLE